jgi:hypothetical protein
MTHRMPILCCFITKFKMAFAAIPHQAFPSTRAASLTS